MVPVTSQSDFQITNSPVVNKEANNGVLKMEHARNPIKFYTGENAIFRTQRQSARISKLGVRFLVY